MRHLLTGLVVLVGRPSAAEDWAGEDGRHDGESCRGADELFPSVCQ